MNTSYENLENEQEMCETYLTQQKGKIGRIELRIRTQNNPIPKQTHFQCQEFFLFLCNFAHTYSTQFFQESS